MNHSSHSRGFTLLETLVALLILAVALTATFRALGATTASAASLQSHLVGDWVAANRLAELRASDAWPDVGNGQGEATQGGRLFHWKEEIKITPNPLFRRVDIAVYADDGGNAVSRLSGFMVKPLR